MASSLYIGTGGESAGGWRVDPGYAPERIFSFGTAHSVYALGLSPQGTRLVAGARVRGRGSQYGHVLLYSRDDNGQFSSKTDLSCYQPSPVTTVEMVREEIALSGGTDGTVRAWSPENPNAPLHELEVHDGPVVALRALSPRIVVTLAAGEKLKLWDWSEKKQIGVSESRPSGEAASFLKVEPIFSGGLDRGNIQSSVQGILALHSDGRICLHPYAISGKTVYQISSPDERETVRSLSTDCASAFSLAGRRLHLYTESNSEIVSYALRSGPFINPKADVEMEELARESCNGSVFRMESLLNGNLALVFKDGSVQIRGENDLEVVTELEVENARCLGSPHVHHKDRRWREGVAAHVESVRKAERFGVAVKKLDALAQAGLDDEECLIILADWARQHERPLAEIEVRRKLTEKLPRASTNAPHFYELARVLEGIGEPAHAQTYYLAAAECRSSYRDASDRAEQLPEDPDLDPPRTIRSDFESVGEAIWAVRKAAFFGRDWDYPITMWDELKEFGPDRTPELERVGEHLITDDWSVEERHVRREDGISQGTFLFFTGEEMPDGWKLSFRFETVEEQTHSAYRLLMLPKTTDSEAGYKELRKRLRSSRQIGDPAWRSTGWLQAACRQIDEAVGRAFETLKDEERKTYF